MAYKTSTGDQPSTAKKADALSKETDDLLTQARVRADRSDVDSAWVFLDAARRLAIFALEPGELENRQWFIRCEVKFKLKEWRKCTAIELLNEKSNVCLAQRLHDVQWLLDDAFHTRYYKNGLLAKQLSILMIVTVCALATLLVLIGRSGTNPAGWGIWDWKSLLLVLLFGVLGACFSASTKMTRSSQADKQMKDRIPDLASQLAGDTGPDRPRCDTRPRGLCVPPKPPDRNQQQRICRHDCRSVRCGVQRALGVETP
jgi:hypothetical protein